MTTKFTTPDITVPQDDNLHKSDINNHGNIDENSAAILTVDQLSIVTAAGIPLVDKLSYQLKKVKRWLSLVNPDRVNLLPV